MTTGVEIRSAATAPSLTAMFHEHCSDEDGLPHNQLVQQFDLKLVDAGTVSLFESKPHVGYPLVGYRYLCCPRLLHESIAGSLAFSAPAVVPPPAMSTCILVSTQSTTGPVSFTLVLDSILAEQTTNPLEGYEQFNQRNWDGYDAEPITAETLHYARRLLRVMPDTFGPPDIAPSGDGSIGLEWVLEKGPLDRLFLDIGPGEEWRAYWKRRNGEFGRLPGTGFDFQTKHVLQKLFADLSDLPDVVVGR